MSILVRPFNRLFCSGRSCLSALVESEGGHLRPRSAMCEAAPAMHVLCTALILSDLGDHHDNPSRPQQALRVGSRCIHRTRIHGLLTGTPSQAKDATMLYEHLHCG
jgi:hypothetical protein